MSCGKFAWFLIKALFNRKTTFKHIISTKSIDEFYELLSKATNEEEYELAAFIKYYITFKFEKQKEIKL
jgi:protein-arginine kinase activator protein McsA